MRLALLILTASFLVACGRESEPEPVADTRPQSGIAITGDARIGVRGSI